MSAIVKVPFHGSEVLAVNHGGKAHVIFRPVVESMGLAYSSQLQRLKRNEWATVVVINTQDQHDGMVAVDLRTLTMWLATLTASRVAESIRPLLVAYQREIADAIEAYWAEGCAVNPRATEGESRRRNEFGVDMTPPDTYTYDEVCGLLRQYFGVNLTVNELTRNLRAGGVLKQNGAPTKKHAHLFWFTGHAWNIHKHVVPQVAFKVYDTGRELQDFRFLQARLELEGVGQDLAVR